MSAEIIDTQLVTAPACRSGIAQDDLARITERIRVRIQRTTADIIETGRDLIQVKNGLGHGRFSKWIETEFGMTGRTAQNYMRAAEWAEGKNEIVSRLPPASIYLLAAKTTPEIIKTKVITDLEAGKPIEMRDIKVRIKMMRTEQRLADRDRRDRKQRAFKRSAKYQRRREQEEAQRKAQREAREKGIKAALEKAVAILLKLDPADLDIFIDSMNAENGGAVYELRRVLNTLNGDRMPPTPIHVVGP